MLFVAVLLDLVEQMVVVYISAKQLAAFSNWTETEAFVEMARR